MIHASGWWVTVKLVYDYWIRNINHLHVFKAYCLNISWSSLYKNFTYFNQLSRVSMCFLCNLYLKNKVTLNIKEVSKVLTCQVFILTPFVVPVSFAMSKTTPVTMPVELSFPRLPMLTKAFNTKKSHCSYKHADDS